MELGGDAWVLTMETLLVGGLLGGLAVVTFFVVVLFAVRRSIVNNRPRMKYLYFLIQLGPSGWVLSRQEYWQLAVDLSDAQLEKLMRTVEAYEKVKGDVKRIC